MNHEHWSEAAAGYALDALEPGEREAFEAHLEGCAECRQAVREFREVTGLLALAAPPIAAPGTLAGTVERSVRSEPRRMSGTAARRAPAWPAWLAAAAALVVAVGAGALARQARVQNTVLEARVDTLTTRLARQDAILNGLRGADVRLASLAAPGADPVLRVLWNQSRGEFVIATFGLPPAAPGRTYQLWAIPQDGAPLSMGTFTPGEDGTAILQVTAEIRAAGPIQLAALTEEPAGGSPQPTETPRLLGTWLQTD